MLKKRYVLGEGDPFIEKGSAMRGHVVSLTDLNGRNLRLNIGQLPKYMLSTDDPSGNPIYRLVLERVDK